MKLPNEDAPLPSTISRRVRKKKNLQLGQEIGGSVTRSQSQSSLRRTRSGLILKRTSSSSSSTSSLSSSSSSKAPNTVNPPPPIPNADTDAPPVIKDLRARRVFSSAPSSISTCCFPHNGHNLPLLHLNFHHLQTSTTSSSIPSSEEDDPKLPSSSIDYPKLPPLSSSIDDPKLPPSSIDNPKLPPFSSSITGSDPKLSPSSIDDSKPPSASIVDQKIPSFSVDDDVFLKESEEKEKGCNVNTPPEEVVAVASAVEISPPPQSPLPDHPIGHDKSPPPSSPPPPLQQLPSTATDGEDNDGSARGGDQIRKTLALAPCSRLKVFSNPTSHCYRRLLPFLVDITKHNSGELEIVSSKSNSKRTEHDAVKKPSPLLVSPLLSNEEEDTKCRSPKEMVSIQDVITKKETVFVNEPKEMSLPKQSFDVPICEFELLSKMEQSQRPILRKDLTFEELAGVSATHRGEKQEPVVDSGRLTPNCTSSVKSILKRKREGCKGPCPCLDCASFRLHAERAFEFSRKQMHDTEDVTTTLMKELGNLRKLVSDSIVPLVGKEGYGILQLNQVQVKDICRRALETEKVARNRLKEMAMDLNVHCRITRRMQHKVTFADHGKDEHLK